MKMKEYKGEKVLAQLTARLKPFHGEYPDCMCELLLTEQHFYALEDNYDGTYEAHVAFPLSQVISMERKKDEETILDDCGGGANPGLYTIFSAVVSLFGVIVVPGGKKRKEREKYLRVGFHTGMGTTDSVHFIDMQSDAGSFCRTFTKLKESF